MSQHIVVWLLLHRDDGFVPSRVEQLNVIVLQFDLQKFIEVEERFVRVADLEVLIDHPSDVPSRECFSSCATSSSIKTLLLEFPLLVFLRPLAFFFVKNLEDVLQFCRGTCI